MDLGREEEVDNIQTAASNSISSCESDIEMEK